MYFRYQPVTSLSAQLKAEQCSLENFSNQQGQYIPQNIELENSFRSKSPPSPRPVEPPSRPFIELMSPRLSQRRLITIPSSIQKNTPKDNTSSKNLTTNSPRGFSNPHKKLSSPAGTIHDSGPVVVATGVSPSIWVPRQVSDSIQAIQLDSQKVNSMNEALNNHQQAYYTNSLPRMDRRTHSVGPPQKNLNRFVELIILEFF